MKENMNCYPADETPTILPELLLADFCSSRSKVEIRILVEDMQNEITK